MVSVKEGGIKKAASIIEKPGWSNNKANGDNKTNPDTGGNEERLGENDIDKGSRGRSNSANNHNNIQNRTGDSRVQNITKDRDKKDIKCHNKN